MRKKLLFCCCLTALMSCSVSNELVSINDCPTEDSEIMVKLSDAMDGNLNVTITRDGNKWEYKRPSDNYKIHFYDVNYDGFNDVILSRPKSDDVEILLWSKDKYYPYNFPNPIFSPSENAIYTGNIYEVHWAHYIKRIWEDETFKGKGSVFEVLTKDYDYNYSGIDRNLYHIKTRYVLNRNELKCDEITELPIEWQNAIFKIKNDYNIVEQHDKVIYEKKQREDSIAAAKEAELERAAEMAYKMYRTDCDNVWIDMGIASDNGETLYWATSDLIIRKDMTFGLSEFGTFGYKFGWGDITGISKSTNLTEYGGANPPSSISGNSQYDIVAAHLNYPARLPSFTEWKKLCDNCTYKFMSIDAGEFGKGDGGLPAWVQGQWMVEARIPQIGGDALVSLSVRIAGSLSSVIVTNGGQVVPIYDGVYDYSIKEDGVGELLMGKIRLLINEENKIIVTETGERLRKINNEGKKQYGLLLTSKINGNRLFFPLPDAHQVVRDGNYAFEFESSQENSYWSGTINKDNNKEAWAFSAKGSNPQDFGLGYATRDIKKCIRPVTTTPVIVTIGTTKINNGDNDEEE